jgi:hypothetical protein
VPITSSLIKLGHDFAVMQKMASGLNKKNRVNNLLDDHTWIPGVEGNENTDENTENDDGDKEQEVDFYDEMEPDEIEGLAHQNIAGKEDVKHMEKEPEADIDEESNPIMERHTEYQNDDEKESQIDFQTDQEIENQSEEVQE